MSATSRKYFNENFKKLIWKPFLQKIKRVKSEKELIKLFDKFFTENEKIILEKRLAIVYLISIGKTYRDISEEVDIAHRTISFVKRGFKKSLVKPRSKTHWINPDFKKPDYKKSPSKFPTYKGKGRWRFLNVS
jgi:uncharacterized protein YerC